MWITCCSIQALLKNIKNYITRINDSYLEALLSEPSYVLLIWAIHKLCKVFRLLH